MRLSGQFHGIFFTKDFEYTKSAKTQNKRFSPS